MRYTTGDNGYREIIVFCALLGLCPLVAAIEPGTATSIRQHGLLLVDIEATLGIDNEVVVHSWLTQRPALHDVVTVVYFAAHLSAVIGVMLWTWHRRRDVYRRFRTALVLTQLGLITGYLVLPTTPPRLLEGHGNYRPVLSEESTLEVFERLQYAHAAFPSGHVAFAVLVAAGLLLVHRSTVRVVLAISYPAFVTWMVVATGNHYWLDAVAGVAVSLAALGITRFGVDSRRAATEPWSVVKQP